MATETEKVAALLPIAEYIAKTKHDGQMAMLRFATGWKVMFGSPLPGTGEGQDDILEAKQFPLLSEALEESIKREISV